ncbi:MAG: ammonium transporter [Alphaproteobacteria bacterium]
MKEHSEMNNAFTNILKVAGLLTVLGVFAANPALAADPPPPPKLDSGDTAWMLTSTALVLMMTIPGLALFYGGMVRQRHVLAIMAQCFVITCLATVLWMVAGYSLSFTEGTPYLGGTSRLFLNGMGAGTLSSIAATIPESVFMMFQMTFAIITPALIVGAFADRMKFSALLLFVTLWLLAIYVPVAHWVWGPGGFLSTAGILDFAGGTVVHINAGIAGLVACLVIGPRKGFGTENLAPHNVGYTVIGASLLWVGWFGFNAGSAVASNGTAGMAMAVTQIAAAIAALAWMFAEWVVRGKPSVLGLASGAVAGLVAITPASGFVNPTGSLVIGAVAGIGCFWASTSLKKILGYDDALDVFGVHCVGGILGALLTGVFADPAISEGHSGLLYGNGGQLVTQGYGVLITLAYSAIVSFVLLQLVKLVTGLRVTSDEEREGLDLSLHGETLYH